MTLAALLRRAERLSAKAEEANDAARTARRAVNAEARRIAWQALARRGIAMGDRIAFTDKGRARWHDRALVLDALEAYRGLDVDRNWCWRVRLRMTALNVRGQRLKTPLSEFFDLSHPREIAREVLKAKDQAK